MDRTELLIVELVISLALLGAFLAYPWFRRVGSVGLPLCYAVNLAMIHWLGGFIHAVPLEWYAGSDPFTDLGFHQAFLGTVACAIGAFAIAPFILRMILHGETCPTIQAATPEQARLPRIYLFLGMAFFVVLAPLLRPVPSIGAICASGVNLVVVGACLFCWQSYSSRDYVKLVRWLVLMCFIPFLTILTQGYVGYGAAAGLVVLMFVATHYRPRWQVLVCLAFLTYLGLSLFVTYFRDRDTIRKSVWGGAAYDQRIEKIGTLFSDFEFIDFQNPRHLRAIDARLNQNYLVGRVVRTIELGQEHFAYGGTLYEALLALVPRIIWPEKPVEAGSGNTVSRYARISFGSGTSVGIGHVMEFYINFGSIGVFIGFLVIGTFIRIADTIAAFRLYEGNWQGFMAWFVPSMSILNVQGSLVELFGTAAASLVLVAIVNKLLNSTSPVAPETGRNPFSRQPAYIP